MPAQLSSSQVDIEQRKSVHMYIFPSLGKFINKVDRVMTQVDRITEDIAQMPVAAFIFRDKESDEVYYSSDIRQILKYKNIGYNY